MGRHNGPRKYHVQICRTVKSYTVIEVNDDSIRTEQAARQRALEIARREPLEYGTPVPATFTIRSITKEILPL
jgi:hypothetical protein